MPKRKNSTKKQKSRKSAASKAQAAQPVLSNLLAISSYYQHEEPKAVMLLDLSKLAGGRMRKSQLTAWLRAYYLECEKRGWESNDDHVGEEDFVSLSHYSNWFNLPSTCWPIIAEHLELDGKGFATMLTVCKAFLAKEQDFLRAADFVRDSGFDSAEALLRRAANEKIPKLLKWSLWQKDLDVNAVDVYKRTALHCAAEKDKNVDLVKALVSAGANVNARDNYDQTPLHYCMQDSQSVEIAKTLISAGANVHLVDKDGWTALHHSAGFCDNLEGLNTLIGANADIAAKDSDGSTAIHLACIGGNLNVLRQLLSLGMRADGVNNDLETPLHYASSYLHANCIKEVLSCRSGASTKNTRNVTGDMPLSLCMKLSCVPDESIECAKILIASGAEYGDNLEAKRASLRPEYLALLSPNSMSEQEKEKYRVTVIHE